MMKTMKKQVMTLCMAVLFVFALVPAVKAEAKENGILQMDAAKLEKSLGAYAGYSVTGLSQTAATESTVTISWLPVEGAVGYYITDDTDKLIDNNLITGTTYTIQLMYPDVADYVRVYPVDAEGQIGYSSYSRTYIKSLPTKINNLEYYASFSGSYKLEVSWVTSIIADGYTVNCYNKNGALVDTKDYTNYYTLTTQYAYLDNTNTQNVYKVEVAGYIDMSNGQRVYGEVSDAFYAVPQPKFTSTNKDVKLHSVNLKWKKVKGATKYEIYASNKPTSGYKKIATVKGSKNKYTVKKFKGKTINTKKKLYMKIVTTAKIDGKNVKSESAAYISAVTTVY